MWKHQSESLYAKIERISDRYQQCQELDERRYKSVIGSLQKAPATEAEFDSFRSEYKRTTSDR